MAGDVRGRGEGGDGGQKGERRVYSGECMDSRCLRGRRRERKGKEESKRMGTGRRREGGGRMNRPFEIGSHYFV